MQHSAIINVLNDCKFRLEQGFKGEKYVHKGRSQTKDKEWFEDEEHYRLRRTAWEENLKAFIAYIERGL